MRRTAPHLRRIARHLGAALGLGLGLAALAPLAAGAQTVVPAYSAEAIYRTPDGTQSTGRVVKSGADMRLEFTEAGREVIQIIRRAEGLMYVLDPQTKSYMIVRGAPDPEAANPAYAPPCQQDAPGATCHFLGTEVTSGITVEQWEIGQQGQPASTILWDGARHRALRHAYPDGTVMAMTFKAMEAVNGRQAEHWTIALTAPGQAVASGDWFYDPELRVEIREVLPTGELRTLENITVGPVDPTAFEVPAGWTESLPPQPQTGQ